MDVLLTGGTGFIGSVVLKQLVTAGHHVTAVVRSTESGKKVEAAGATHMPANIENTDELTEQIAPFDALIHLATPSDETSVSVDLSVATAATSAFANTNKVYVHTGGVWVYGDGTDITESSPINPSALTAWRRDVEQVALGGAGMRTSIVEPGVVYGHGKGLPNLLINAQTTDTGSLQMVGDGSQHWATVYVDDLADLFVRVVTNGRQGYYIGASGQNPSMREMCEAISRAAGNGDVYPSTAEDAARRLGSVAEAFLLDQQAQGSKAKSELGWSPSGPSLIDEFETGSYSPKGSRTAGL